MQNVQNQQAESVTDEDKSNEMVHYHEAVLVIKSLISKNDFVENVDVNIVFGGI